jgi:hypothetical protein
MSEGYVDHTVWSHTNNGRYQLSIIARLQGPLVSNIQFMVRLRNPENVAIDYTATLDGFKQLGELFLALHNVCKHPMYADGQNIAKLKTLLTTENIKNLSEFLDTLKLQK